MSDEAIVEIVQPPANDGEKQSGESDDEVENPPRILTTQKVTAALEALIAYMKQHPKLQCVSDHLDGDWTLNRDIDVLQRQGLAQPALTKAMTMKVTKNLGFSSSRVAFFFVV